MTATTNHIDQFITQLNAKFGADYVFSVEMGRKNARVVRTPVTQGNVVCSFRSAYCFIRLEDGAVLKTNSWKAPAKGVRAWLDQVLANDLKEVDPYTRWLYR